MKQWIVNDETGQRWVVTEQEPMYSFLSKFNLPFVTLTVPRHYFLENENSSPSISNRPKGYYPRSSQIAMNDDELTRLMVEEVYLLLKAVERDYDNTYRVPRTGTVFQLEG